MSEAQSPKAIIAESILENFEAVHSYVARQSLRDMLDENQAFRDECERLRKLIRTYLTAKDEALKTSEDQDCEEWREKYRAYWDAHEALDATLAAQDAGKGVGKA